MQRECGVKKLLRVAPLFETLDDLDASEDAMKALLSNPWYHAHINGEQECMIGYSDSGKDAGRLAAAWGLYEVQVPLYLYFSAEVYIVQEGPCHQFVERSGRENTS